MRHKLLILSLLLVICGCADQADGTREVAISPKDAPDPSATFESNPMAPEPDGAPSKLPTSAEHGHDHDHDHDDVELRAMDTIGGLPFVPTAAQRNAMADSGSYNVDMTRTGRWNLFEAQFREGNDTVFVKMTGNYQKNKKAGTWKIYITRDRKPPFRWKLEEQVDFAEDEKHGERKFFKNGFLFIHEQYKRDQLHGTSYYYDDFGDLALEVNYQNNVRHGVVKQYDPGRKLKALATFEYGGQKGYYANYHPNGKLREEGYSIGGQAEGSWKLYHPNGQLWTERVYKNGLPWEVKSNFDEKGVARNAGSLKNGSGTMFLYTGSKLVATERYEGGKLVD